MEAAAAAYGRDLQASSCSFRSNPCDSRVEDDEDGIV